MLSDPQFWVFIAFCIFILIVFKPIKNMLTLNLDSKINEIKNTIKNAEDLKNESQQTLSEIKKRQDDVQIEIKNMQSDSEKKIKLIEKESKQKLDEQINKRNILAKNKIEQMSRDANVEIQQYLVNNSIEATIKILEKKLNQEQKGKLINQSIVELNNALKH